MKTWNDFITREDLETETGEIDLDKVRALSVNLYLDYIEGCIELGGYEFPDIASERIEDIMLDEFCCYTHAMEGRYPETEEIQEHLNKPENIEVRKNWTDILTQANKENWPDTLKRFREELNVPEDVPLKNEKEIDEMIKKQIEERTWVIKEL